MRLPQAQTIADARALLFLPCYHPRAVFRHGPLMAALFAIALIVFGSLLLLVFLIGLVGNIIRTPSNLLYFILGGGIVLFLPGYFCVWFGRDILKRRRQRKAAEEKLAAAGGVTRPGREAQGRLTDEPCFLCGAVSGPSRMAPPGSWAEGQIVSGHLCYCPECDCNCCVPCATHDDAGLHCPHCGGELQEDFPAPA